jgi:hypothetical protein
MAIQVSWEDPQQKQIILCRAEGRWSWDELEAGLAQAIRLMSSVNHTVHFIIDIRGSHLNLATALGQAQKAATPETNKNEGIKVVVGANRMVRMVYEAYRKITQAMGKDQVFHFTDTLDQAHALIARQNQQQVG